MSLEDKHLNHIAKMQAITDNNWYSWGSPVGLTFFFLGFIIFLNGIALFGILVRFIFLMK